MSNHKKKQETYHLNKSWSVFHRIQLKKRKLGHLIIKEEKYDSKFAKLISHLFTYSNKHEYKIIIIYKKIQENHT